MTSKTFDGLEFDTVIVNKGISLVIAQGDAFKVEVQTGENLISDIAVTVENGTLTLQDQTTCNWVRDYGQTVVYVTAPDLKKIYSKTEKPVVSTGSLAYPNLHIVSMDAYDQYNGTGTGDFYLNIDCENLQIDNNTVSRFYLSGSVVNLNIAMYESGGIFYGQDLYADQVYVFHRGSNDIYVRATVSLRGDIFNIGNVISVIRPTVIDVTEHYRGRLFIWD